MWCAKRFVLTVLFAVRRRVQAWETWEDGQSMVEYAIIAALIAIAAMGAIQAMGGGITQVFQHILARISGLAS